MESTGIQGLQCLIVCKNLALRWGPGEAHPPMDAQTPMSVTPGGVNFPSPPGSPCGGADSAEWQTANEMK